MNATQQIQSAASQLGPQIYRAVMAQPTPAGRAQVLRMILVGVDPALSERVASRVEALEAGGVVPKQAVLQAISEGLAVHMAELAQTIDAELSGLGTTTTTTTTRTGSAARMNAIGNMITDIGGVVNTLTQTAGNIAISSRQARTRQAVTGLPGVPQQAGAALPYDTGMTLGPPTTVPPAGPPWGLILGGVAVVGLLGGAYYYTTQKKKAPTAAATAP